MRSVKPPAVTPRIRVLEPLANVLMVTVYQGNRPGELGHVGYIPHGPVRPTRPGGSASS